MPRILSREPSSRYHQRARSSCLTPEWLSGIGRVPDPDKPLDYYTEVPPDPTRPGLRVVYDWFVESLKGSPYEAFAIEIRDRWRKRVAEKRWPRFTAS